MATYILSGKYSREAVKEVSAERTEKAIALIKKHGGEVKAGYALLGEADLLLILELPGTETAMQVSMGLSKLLGIGFVTAPAIGVDEFDKLIEK
jgi:uncharacterized protein with GYD domain